jgi:hypothetical protein
MSVRKRRWPDVWPILICAAVAATPAAGCDLYYPPDYVAPTNEELISVSRAAFVGHVVGYRLNDGSVIDRDIECEANFQDFRSCWDKRDTIVSAILSVDIDVRGMGLRKLFEDDRSAEPGADCGNYYADDTVFLVTGFGPEPLAGMPSAATIEGWRSLPAKSAVAR